MINKRDLKGKQKLADEVFLKWYKERLPLWKEDPILFSREVCLINPVGEQKTVLKALVDNDKLAVKAGRAVGKSVVAGISALWFITVNYNSLVLITATDFKQLKDVIFGTIKEIHRKSPLLKIMFDVTDETFRHKVLRSTWQIVIKTASTSEGMRGYNRPNKFYIMDEATGISDDIIDALLGSTDEANSKVLMISNPTKRSGKFYHVFTNPTSFPEWKRISFSKTTAYEIIALTSVEAADKSLRRWKQQIKAFGSEHPRVRVEILGEFPTQDNKMAFDMKLFDYIGKGSPFKDKREIVSINLGVDIAGMGGDAIVFTTNMLNYDYDRPQEKQYKKPIEYFDVLESYSRQNYTFSRNRLIVIAKSIVREYAALGGNFKMLYINIDATGVGSAFMDSVTEALEGCREYINGHELRKWVRVRGTVFSNAAFDKDHYTNQRSEMGEQFVHKLEANKTIVNEGGLPIIYMNFRNALLQRGIDNEMANIEKEFDNKQRIKYESKEKLRKRLKGSSTDIADSLLLSSYIKKTRALWFI